MTEFVSDTSLKDGGEASPPSRKEEGLESPLEIQLDPHDLVYHVGEAIVALRRGGAEGSTYVVGGVDESGVVVSVVVRRGGDEGHLIPVGVHAAVVRGVVVVAGGALERGRGRHRHGNGLQSGDFVSAL